MRAHPQREPEREGAMTYGKPTNRTARDVDAGIRFAQPGRALSRR
jgi:hypothetical protein